MLHFIEQYFVSAQLGVVTDVCLFLLMYYAIAHVIHVKACLCWVQCSNLASKFQLYYLVMMLKDRVLAEDGVDCHKELSPGGVKETIWELRILP